MNSNLIPKRMVPVLVKMGLSAIVVIAIVFLVSMHFGSPRYRYIDDYPHTPRFQRFSTTDKYLDI